MRIVADTNVVVSGLLWQGPSRAVLDAARAGTIRLFTSPSLLAELADVLARPKLARRITVVRSDVRKLVADYSFLADVIDPDTIEAVVIEDPDDDAVLACASAARADAIVSGDGDLLRLGRFRDMPVLTAAELANRLRA